MLQLASSQTASTVVAVAVAVVVVEPCTLHPVIVAHDVEVVVLTVVLDNETVVIVFTNTVHLGTALDAQLGVGWFGGLLPPPPPPPPLPGGPHAGPTQGGLIPNGGGTGNPHNKPQLLQRNEHLLPQLL